VFYEVLGARYYVLAGSVGYRERGVASWYGPGFSSGPDLSGEIYDMNKMTAAHKTLPLPCFAQVTNLRNGKSVVVRINDRGPFVANRLIDLSYAAATKLDMLREGTTLVEVRTLEAPDTPAPAPIVAKGDLFIAAGAFTEERNAERMLATLRSAGIGPASCARRPSAAGTFIGCASVRCPTCRNSTGWSTNCAAWALPMHSLRSTEETMARILSGLMLVFVAAVASAADEPPLGRIDAPAFVVVDHGSGRVLAARNATDALEPASLTN